MDESSLQLEREEATNRLNPIIASPTIKQIKKKKNLQDKDNFAIIKIISTNEIKDNISIERSINDTWE